MKNLLVFLCALLFLPASASAADWYVDKDAIGSNNGASWENAWINFSSIKWASVKPGDTIYISGGTASKTYYETLTIGASGISGNPISIRVGQSSPHNGTVIIDGNWSRAYGIFMSGKTYISISGQVGSDTGQNIQLTRHKSSGMWILGASNYFDIGYLDIFRNCDQNGGLGGGIYLVVNEVPYLGDIHNCKIHDNYGAPNLWLYCTDAKCTDYSQYDILLIHDNEFYNF